MPYEDLQTVRKKMSDHLVRDIKGMDRATADRMAEASVRRSADRIEREVKKGRRSAT